MLLFDRLDAELRHSHGIGLADYEILVQLSEAPDAPPAHERAGRRRPWCPAAASPTGSIAWSAAGLVERRPAPPIAGACSPCSARRGEELLSQAAPTHVGGVRRYAIDPLSPDTRRAMTEELVAPLADLQAQGATINCPGSD